VTTLDALLTTVVLPYLHELGDRWQRGEASIAQEHFASAVLRGRLLGLARGWGRGLGPLALLACLPGEQHDLGLIAFGLALRARGWRIAYLGPDTPLDTLDAAAGSLAPALVVVTSVDAARVARVTDELADLAGRYRLALGGSGPDEDAAAEIGAAFLGGDPVAAAEAVTALQPQSAGA
jgi:methanogenic corrinoid protein MtbC1